PRPSPRAHVAGDRPALGGRYALALGGRAPGAARPERSTPVAARDASPSRRGRRTPAEAPAEGTGQPRDGADAGRVRRRPRAGAPARALRLAPRRPVVDAGRGAGGDPSRGLTALRRIEAGRGARGDPSRGLTAPRRIEAGRA